MKLWLLRPAKGLKKNDDPWEVWYDKAFGFVVRAETEEEARKLANKAGGEETGEKMVIVEHIYQVGGDPWLDAKYSSCVELTADGKPEVIIVDLWSA